MPYNRTFKEDFLKAITNYDEQLLYLLCREHCHSETSNDELIEFFHTVLLIVEKHLDAIPHTNIMKLFDIMITDTQSLFTKILLCDNDLILSSFAILCYQLIVKFAKIPQYLSLLKIKSLDYELIGNLLLSEQDLNLILKLFSTLDFCIKRTIVREIFIEYIERIHQDSIYLGVLFNSLVDKQRKLREQVLTMVEIVYLIENNWHYIPANDNLFIRYLNNIIHDVDAVTLYTLYKNLLEHYDCVESLTYCLCDYYSEAADAEIEDNKNAIYDNFNYSTFQFSKFCGTTIKLKVGVSEQNNIAIIDTLQLLIRPNNDPVILFNAFAKGYVILHNGIVSNQSTLMNLFAIRGTNYIVLLKLLSLLNAFLESCPTDYFYWNVLATLVDFNKYIMPIIRGNSISTDNKQMIYNSRFWKTISLHLFKSMQTIHAPIASDHLKLYTDIPIIDYTNALCHLRGIFFPKDTKLAISYLITAFADGYVKLDEVIAIEDGLDIIENHLISYTNPGALCTEIERIWVSNLISSRNAIILLRKCLDHTLGYNELPKADLHAIYMLLAIIHQRENSIFAATYFYAAYESTFLSAEDAKVIVEYFFHHGFPELTKTIITKLTEQNPNSDDIPHFQMILRSIDYQQRHNKSVNTNESILAIPFLEIELFLIDLTLQQRINLIICAKSYLGKVALNELFSQFGMFIILPSISSTQNKSLNLLKQIIVKLSDLQFDSQGRFVHKLSELKQLQQFISKVIKDDTYRSVKNILQAVYRFLDMLSAQNASALQNEAKAWAQFSILKSLSIANKKLNATCEKRAVANVTLSGTFINNNYLAITTDIIKMAFNTDNANGTEQNQEIDPTEGFLASCVNHANAMPYLPNTKIYFADLIINLHRGITAYLQNMQKFSLWQHVRSRDGCPRALAFRELLKQNANYKQNPEAICIIIIALLKNDKGRNLLSHVIQQFACSEDQLFDDLWLFLDNSRMPQERMCLNQIITVMNFVDGKMKVIPIIGIQTEDNQPRSRATP